MARKKNLVFETQSRSDRGNARKFWIILTVSVLAVLLVSVALILKNNDYDINAAFGFEKETETTEVPDEVQTDVFEAERYFLIFCTDSDKQKINFMSLVRTELPECRVTVCAVDPYSVLETTESGSETAASVFVKSGERALVSSIERAYGIDIDRYVGTDETDFKTFINYFGGMKITVPEQIDYKTSEMSLVLIKGNQNLKGDTMFKYMCYLNSLGSEGKRRQSAAMLEILGGIFSQGNLNRRSRIFSQITNNMMTDMSIVDFSQEENGIVLLMQNGILQPETVDYPEEIG